MKKQENPSQSSSPNDPIKVKTKPHPFWRFFWLSFLVISLAYAWYSFYVPSNDVIWADDMDSAIELASRSNKNIMQFYTGEWCVPCRIMKRNVFGDEEIMKAINEQVVPVMIDVDDPKAQGLVKQHNIGTTPITIFTDAQGKVLDYAVGKIGKVKFVEMLEGIK